jgi:hypothetical protein
MTQEIRCAKLLRRVIPESVILVTIRSAQVVGNDMEPIRVLLVDDDQAVLEMMQRGLTIADEVDSQLRESIGSYLQHARRQPAA